jgi:hypothetical protein
LGWRNRALILLRDRWLGDEFEAYAECPACGLRLELEFPSGRLLGYAETPAEPPAGSLEAGGVTIDFRTPSSRDLLQLEASGGEAQSLAEACVLRISGSNALPAGLVEPLAARMLQLDPLAEIQLDLDCSGCGHRWQMILDLPSFLWKEISARARRLLLEVDALARVYGWSERDILAMSSFRRQCYLELLGT